MKRNMFGEMNFWCWLIGHKMVLFGGHCICARCEVDDERLDYYVSKKFVKDEQGVSK